MDIIECREENGTICWYKNGKLDRDDGPALENNSGTNEWYKQGQLHREDGPAIEYINKNTLYRDEWYLKGVRLSEEKTNILKLKIKLEETLHSNQKSKTLKI